MPFSRIGPVEIARQMQAGIRVVCGEKDECHLDEGTEEAMPPEGRNERASSGLGWSAQVVVARRSCSVAVTLFGMLSLVGCYAYREVPVSEVRQGVDVRVHLTSEEANRLASAGMVTFGSQATGVLEGGVLERNRDTMVLSAPFAVSDGGSRESREVLEQRVRLHIQEVIRVEERELDRNRTYLAIGVAGAVSAAILLNHFTGTAGGSTIPPPPDGPPESRGVFSFPILGTRLP